MPDPTASPAVTRSMDKLKSIAEGITTQHFEFKSKMDSSEELEGAEGVRPKESTRESAKAREARRAAMKEAERQRAAEQERAARDVAEAVAREAEVKKKVTKGQLRMGGIMPDAPETQGPSLPDPRYFETLGKLHAKEAELIGLQRKLEDVQSRQARMTDIKPTKYNGTGDLEDYLTQFFSIAKFHGWTEAQTVVTLLSKLEGEALSVAATLDQPSLDTLTWHLRQTFSAEQQEIAAMKLQSKRQGGKETYESLSLEIQKLTKKAYPSADIITRDKLAKDAFVNAVADDYVRGKLREHNPTVLKDALLEARRLAANQEIEKTRTKETVRVAAEQPPEKDAELEKLRQEVKQLKLRNKNSRAPRHQGRNVEKKARNPPTCFKCYQPGHIARWCPIPDELLAQWRAQGLIPTPNPGRSLPNGLRGASFPVSVPNETTTFALAPKNDQGNCTGQRQGAQTSLSQRQ